MKPVWLLDIDGVLNAATHKPDTSVWAEKYWNADYAVNQSGQWKITWATPVVDFIRGVHEDGRAEIRWHTTWQHDAQAVADLTGLPVFDVALAPEFLDGAREAADAFRERRKPTWWKLPAAQRVIADEGRPVVWTDDDIADALWRDGGLSYPLGTVEAPALLVCPRVNIGLTPKHLRRISEFLAHPAGGHA